MSYISRTGFLSVLVSLKALIETDNVDKAVEVIDTLIDEAKKNQKKSDDN